MTRLSVLMLILALLAVARPAAAQSLTVRALYEFEEASPTDPLVDSTGTQADAPLDSGTPVHAASFVPGGGQMLCGGSAGIVRTSFRTPSFVWGGEYVPWGAAFHYRFGGSTGSGVGLKMLEIPHISGHFNNPTIIYTLADGSLRTNAMTCAIPSAGDYLVVLLRNGEGEWYRVWEAGTGVLVCDSHYSWASQVPNPSQEGQDVLVGLGRAGDCIDNFMIFTGEPNGLTPAGDLTGGTAMDEALAGAIMSTPCVGNQDAVCEVGETCVTDCLGFCSNTDVHYDTLNCHCDGDGACQEGEDTVGLCRSDCNSECDPGDEAASTDCDGVCTFSDTAGSPDCDMCDGNGVCEVGELATVVCYMDCDGRCDDTDEAGSVDCPCNLDGLCGVDEPLTGVCAGECNGVCESGDDAPSLDCGCNGDGGCAAGEWNGAAGGPCDAECDGVCAAGDSATPVPIETAAIADAVIGDDFPDAAAGASYDLFVGRRSDGKNLRSIVRFPKAGLGPGDTLTGVSFAFDYLYLSSAPRDLTYSLWLLSGSGADNWVEGTSHRKMYYWGGMLSDEQATTGADVTWNEAVYGVEAWDTAGGDLDTLLATVTVNTAALTSGQEISFDVTDPAVLTQLTTLAGSGGVDHFSVVLVGPSETRSAMKLRSRERASTEDADSGAHGAGTATIGDTVGPRVRAIVDTADCDGTCDDSDPLTSADCITVCDGNGVCDSGESGDGSCSVDCDGVCSMGTDALDSADCDVPFVLLVDEVSGSIVDNDLITAFEAAVPTCAGQLAVGGKAADSFDNTQTRVSVSTTDATCLSDALTEAAKLGTSALTLLGTYDVLSLQFSSLAYSLGSVGGDIVGGTSDVGTAYRSVQVEMPAGSSLPATDMSVSMPVLPDTTSKDVRVRLYGSTATAPVNPRTRGRGRPSAVSYQETTFTVDANLAGTSSSVDELDSPFLVCVDVGGLGTPSLLFYSESNNAWFNAAQTCIDYPIPEAVGVVESVDEAPVYEFGAPFSRVDSDRLCTWICHLTQYAVFDAAATTTGDPHFEGFHGGWYDFMGEAGKVFNLFTDTTLHVNARFVEFGALPGQTYMGEIGVRAGPHRVYMAADGTVRVPDAPGCVLVDPSEPNKCALSGGGHVRWSDERVDIEWDVYRLSLTTEVWTFEGTDAEAHGLGYSMAVNHAALARSGRTESWAPHGVHGQVADVQHVVVGSGKQGEGVVAGHFRDYEVASGDLFGVDVMHAQWSESAAVVRSEESEESEWEVEGVSARAQ